jgi:hypothetical protein
VRRHGSHSGSGASLPSLASGQKGNWFTASFKGLLGGEVRIHVPCQPSRRVIINSHPKTALWWMQDCVS